MRDLFFNFLLRQGLLVELGSGLEHFNLFGLFSDLALVALNTGVLIFWGQLLLKVEVLVENSVSVQMGFADAFLPAETVVQLFVDVINHDIFPVLELQYS